MKRHQLPQIRHFRILRIPPRPSRDAQIVHRHEDRVGPDQRDEEMHPSPHLIHHPPKHFREPIIGRRKHSEDRRHSHDQMEMPHYKISVVQRDVEHRLRQERPTQPARNEKGNKSNGIQHRRVETNARLMHRPQPVKRLDGRRHANAHGQQREGKS